jgi:2-keto-4-pentenoate hydratase/2-oxohepta-3-ene-1,7-dioic acid hydratase in catechol pathway
MHIVRIQHQGATHFARAAGQVADAQVYELLTGAPWHGAAATGTHVRAENARLLAPVTPSKIVCVGKNYAAHAKELGTEVPSEPLIFLKPPSALLAAEGDIVLPPESTRVDYEAEIGVVIGTRLHRATPEQALQAVFGYTCVNDVTARDIQRREVQFTRAKSFDTFCPVGPCIATELAHESLIVTGRVNGVVKQQASASLMVTSIPKLLAFISQIMTLEPGDLISTGTPEGVGPLSAADMVEIEVSGVGVLRNRVVAR